MIKAVSLWYINRYMFYFIVSNIIDRGKNEWMNGWMDERMEGWMDGWMDG